MFWWQVLGLDGPTRDVDVIQDAWHAASREAHPDRPGGSHAQQVMVNEARSIGLAHAASLQAQVDALKEDEDGCSPLGCVIAIVGFLVLIEAVSAGLEYLWRLIF